MKTFLLNRFKEPSSWFGLFLIAGSFGFELSETQQMAITYFGMAMFAAPDTALDSVKKKLKK